MRISLFAPLISPQNDAAYLKALARGADATAAIPSTGQTALMWATAEGHVALMEALIAAGADIHAPSSIGFTPLLFAVLAETVGLTSAFVATAIVGAPSVLLPLAIASQGKAERTAARGSVLRETWEGLKYVRHHPLLPGIYLMDIGVTVVTFYRQILPVLAFQLFRGGPAAVGVLTAANSVGAIAGGILVLFLAPFRAKGMLVVYATFVYALLVLAFGLSSSLLMGAFVIAGLGAADAVTVVVRQATVQLTTPAEMLGRASSVQSAAAQTANNIGTLEVGLLAGAIGASNTMLIGGAFALAATVVIWRSVPAIRDYRYP